MTPSGLGFTAFPASPPAAFDAAPPAAAATNPFGAGSQPAGGEAAGAAWNEALATLLAEFAAETSPESPVPSGGAKAAATTNGPSRLFFVETSKAPNVVERKRDAAPGAPDPAVLSAPYVAPVPGPLAGTTAPPAVEWFPPAAPAGQATGSVDAPPSVESAPAPPVPLPEMLCAARGPEATDTAGPTAGAPHSNQPGKPAGTGQPKRGNLAPADTVPADGRDRQTNPAPAAPVAPPPAPESPGSAPPLAPDQIMIPDQGDSPSRSPASASGATLGDAAGRPEPPVVAAAIDERDAAAATAGAPALQPVAAPPPDMARPAAADSFRAPADEPSRTGIAGQCDAPCAASVPGRPKTWNPAPASEAPAEAPRPLEVDSAPIDTESSRSTMAWPVVPPAAVAVPEAAPGPATVIPAAPRTAEIEAPPDGAAAHAPVAFLARVVRREDSAVSAGATGSTGTGPAVEPQPAPRPASPATMAPPSEPSVSARQPSTAAPSVPPATAAHTGAPHLTGEATPSASALNRASGQAIGNWRPESLAHPAGRQPAAPRERAERPAVPSATNTPAAPADNPATVLEGARLANTVPPAGPRAATPSPDSPPPASSQPPAAALPSAPPAASSGELRVRLERDTNDPAVEVRVKDQAGELRVSVRTPDGALADAMREGLPELVERLDRRGFHTEVWRPGAHEPATGSGRSGLRAPEAESSPGGGFSRDNGGSQAQTGNGREDEPQPSSEEWETAWLASRRSADRRRSSWQLR